MIRFSVDVHENGVVITPMGLGSGPSKVFEKEHIEDALLEIYHLCFNWKVGDRIKIVRKTTEDTDNAEAEIARLRAMLRNAVEMLEYEYANGDGVPEQFYGTWKSLLAATPKAQEERG